MPRETAPFCTCPFGACEVHDPTLDGATLADLNPLLVMRALQLAAELTDQRVQCDGEVYAVPVAVADKIEDVLRQLARTRRDAGGASR